MMRKNNGNEKIEQMAELKVNRKYKDTFRTKAKMIPFEDVERLIGHAPGGVCPFGVPDNVDVYLDESLRQFETVYPAAGNDHSAVKLTLAELERQRLGGCVQNHLNYTCS